MLKNLTIKRYQSLHDVDLALAPFTVIVGPSSSGKSALTRAVKALAGNERGTRFIENGEKTALIQAESDTHRVALLRSTTSSGPNEYRVTPLNGAETPTEARYAKLGGTTPPEVSEALRMSPGASEWLAGQFDRPYLLADSGGEVARTLGALTNVSVIFEAAREANRQRAAQAGVLKTRQSDISGVKNLLGNISGLKARRAAVAAAEDALADLEAAQRDLAALDEAWSSLSISATALKSAKKRLEVSDEAITRANVAVQELRDLENEWSDLVEAATTLKSAQKRAEQAAAAVLEAQQEYDDTLHAMGKCPTCGQAV